jgi:hypothetical protein
MPGTAMPGEYWAVYTCANSAGIEASPATRRYTVSDTTCPVCRLNAQTGAETIEASFPYTDAGARCTDDIDGDLNVSTWSDGTATNWTEIVNVETTGTYLITYRAQDSSGNWNDGGGSQCQNAQELVRTLTVVDTLKPVMALKFHGKVIQVSKSSSLERHYVDHNAAPNGLQPAGMTHSMDDETTGFHYKNPAEYHARRLLSSDVSSSKRVVGFAALLSAFCGIALLVLGVFRSYRSKKAASGDEQVPL